MNIEQCYGVVIVLKEEENKFLILKHEPKPNHEDQKGNWSFPKGHHEGKETPKETALREVAEETGITEVSLLDIPLIHEEYGITYSDKKNFKVNEYFIGFVKEKKVTIQESEINTYKWATYEEAMNIFNYDSRKDVLKKAKEYLDKI
jgi:tRNA nucleotidyltransferase (CCA-adding enzyme)